MQGHCRRVSGLTRYLVHWDKVSVLLFDFGSVPGDEVNSQERQQTAGMEFSNDQMPWRIKMDAKVAIVSASLANLPEEKHEYVQQSQAFKFLVENDAWNNENAH